MRKRFKTFSNNKKLSECMGWDVMMKMVGKVKSLDTGVGEEETQK
jgi:hypothetical protein